MLEAYIKSYYDSLVDTDRETALDVVKTALKEGISPEDIVFKIVVPNISAVMNSLGGNLGLSLAQHYMTAQISSEVVDQMIPLFKVSPDVTGTVVMGTPPGDFHGLGKRIVGGCLRSLMIQVVDLGLNVNPEKFVDEAVKNQAQVICISSMMLHTTRGPKGCLAVRAILKERKLEDQIRIVVGGAPYAFDPNLYKTVGADAWAPNALEASQEILKMIREVKK